VISRPYRHRRTDNATCRNRPGQPGRSRSTGLGACGLCRCCAGTLVINGKEYQDPSGCYSSDRSPLSVTNRTNEAAIIFEGSNCTGQPLEIVAPGNGTVSEFGGGVYIP
jgi:hypothetical protein